MCSSFLFSGYNFFLSVLICQSIPDISQIRYASWQNSTPQSDYSYTSSFLVDSNCSDSDLHVINLILVRVAILVNDCSKFGFWASRRELEQVSVGTGSYFKTNSTVVFMGLTNYSIVFKGAVIIYGMVGGVTKF